MYKSYIFSKIFLLFFIFLLSITLGNINKLCANTNNQNSTSNADINSNIQINIPTENIKNIPIIGYKLIYTTGYASLLDFLDKDIKNLTYKLSKLGIKTKNIVIIYTDYVGDSPSEYTIQQLSTKPSLTQKELNNYTTDEGINLNLSYISKKYYLPFLLTKRKVLIGTLVNDKQGFTDNENLKVIKFNIPDAMGFQAYCEKDKIDIYSNKEKTTNNTSIEPSNRLLNKVEIIINRCSMIKYMNLSFNKNTKFIGMMEYYDITNNTYAYFSIPGTIE